MAFERAANDPTAAPTEMMPRFAFRNERNDSDAISTAAISCVTHGSGEIGITMCVPKTLSVRRRI
jgi:hypothetical protein